MTTASPSTYPHLLLPLYMSQRFSTGRWVDWAGLMNRMESDASRDGHGHVFRGQQASLGSSLNDALLQDFSCLLFSPLKFALNPPVDAPTFQRGPAVLSPSSLLTSRKYQRYRLDVHLYTVPDHTFISRIGAALRSGLAALPEPIATILYFCSSIHASLSLLCSIFFPDSILMLSPIFILSQS